jgi:dienelactone hydrolase
MASSRVPDLFPADQPPLTPEAWRLWREDRLARFRDLLGDGPRQRPAPQARVEREIAAEGYTQRLLSYDLEADDRGWAWLLTPAEESAPRPAVVCLHGTTADAKDACLGLGAHPGGSAGIAVHLVRRGFVALAPDHFCAGQRLLPGQQPYDPTAFYARHPGWSEMGKNLYDSQQALDLLANLPEVDAGRLGCIGHSLGGYGALFLAAVDERVQATVCSCGITSWRLDPLRENWSRTAPGRYRHFPKLRQYFETDAELPLDMPDLMACVAPRALLNLSAVGNDSCFPLFEPFAEIYVQVERAYKLLKAEGRFGCYFHSETHSFNASPRALAYAWLQERLGLSVDLGGRAP